MTSARPREMHVGAQKQSTWKPGGPDRCATGEDREAPERRRGHVLPATGWRKPQEVSAFGEDGEGDFLDDWTVLCNGEYWQREEEVRFKHVSTSVLLSVTGEQYGRPINGQREVHGMTYASPHNYWKAMEGIFMKPSEFSRTDYTHSEL